MSSLDHCAATCGRWALATWRALTPEQASQLASIHHSGRVDRRRSLVWAERAGLVFCGSPLQLTPLGSLVVSAGASVTARAS